MSTRWLAAQSFQHSQDLVTAINIVSIHLKLRLAGIPDADRIPAAQRARETLASFFQQLDSLVQAARQGEMGPTLGVSPRLRQLVKNFIAAQRDHHRFQSALFQKTPSEMQRLLASDTEEDQHALIECLKEMRTLLEEHVWADTSQLMREL